MRPSRVLSIPQYYIPSLPDKPERHLLIMPIEVSCQSCQKTFRVKDEYSGKKIRCPSCKGIVDVPFLVAEMESIDVEETSVATRQIRLPTNQAPAPPSGRVPGRKQRDYIHLRCGASTTIDGPEFRAMADPLAGMVATYCAQCGDVFSIDQFVWSDTREAISDYYLRYQSMGSPFQNFLASRTGMYVLAAIPFAIAMIGFLIWRNNWFIFTGLLLAIITIALHTVFLGPAILKQILGTGDARELR